MPHAWPFTALSAAWRKRCVSTDDRGIVSAVEAFADRTPIDWPALRASVRGAHDQTLIDALQALDAFRGPAREAAGTRESPRHPIMWAGVALAALQIAIAVALVLPSLPSGAALEPAIQLLVAMAFAVSALLLGAGTARDSRRIFLLGFLVCAGSSFARASLTSLPGGAAAWTRPLWLDALAPACLWQFALDFPRVDRFARFDLVARRVAAVAWMIGGVAIAANLGVVAGLVTESLAQPLLPNDPGAAFWRGYSVATIAALATIFVRARRAPRDERQKVARLAAALVAGASPFLLLGLARTAIPGFERWFLDAAPAARLPIDVVVIVSLLATPLLAAAAVVLDRPFDRQQRLAQAGRRLIVRAAIWSAARHRRHLTAALRALRTARGSREVSYIVTHAVRAGLNASVAHVLVRHGDCFRDSLGADLSTHQEAAFVAMLRASPQPLNLSATGGVHGMLPEREREWLDAESIQLAAPIVARDGSVAAIIVIGNGEAVINLDRRARWFAEALAAAAAAVWIDEPSRTTAGGGLATMDAAWECPICGAVQDAAPVTCGCGARAVPAVVPARLAGIFVVRRRLGAGGMGVVYQARDLRLDRDVALKTLPAVAPGSVDRLHREARAMASLNHDALATILGLEFWRDVPVLICEFFPEGTLADRLAQRGPLSPVDAIRLVARLARGLDHMHAIGLRHGDIKPGNIGITARSHAKLLDFGLSRLTAIDLDDGMRRTIDGTLAYLPPEALRGEPPSPSFDLWALAIVLLECLLGRNPLAGDLDPLTRRAVATADAVALTAPVRAMHAPLAAILARALGPAPDRFTSADAFANALDQLVPDERMPRT